MEPTKVMPNSSGGMCVICKQNVARQAGYIIRKDEGSQWLIHHAGCIPASYAQTHGIDVAMLKRGVVPTQLQPQSRPQIQPQVRPTKAVEAEAEEETSEMGETEVKTVLHGVIELEQLKQQVTDYAGDFLKTITPALQTSLVNSVDKRAEVKFQEINAKVAESLKQTAMVFADLGASIKKDAIEAAKSVVPIQHVVTVKQAGKPDVTQTGKPHKNFGDLLQVISCRLHPFLVGPAGSGKTTAANKASQALSLPYFEASMGPATSQWDLFGYRTATGSYVPGVMREPYESGGILMLDEIDNSNPAVLTALNSALANGYATFPDKRVTMHPDFVCVGAGNTYGLGADRVYVGRMQIDGATLDRFVTITWDYDEEAEYIWTGEDQKEWVKQVQTIRHEAIRHAMRVVISPRASIFGAKLLRAGMLKSKVMEMCIWKGISKDDRKKLEQVVDFNRSN